MLIFWGENWSVLIFTPFATMPLGPLCLQQCFFDFPVSSLCRLHFLIFCREEKTYHCFWRNSIFMTSSWRKKTWNNFYLMKQFLCWNGFLTFHSLPLSLSLHLNNHRDLRKTFPRLDLFTTQDYTFWIIENPRQRFSLLLFPSKSVKINMCH